MAQLPFPSVFSLKPLSPFLCPSPCHLYIPYLQHNNKQGMKAGSQGNRNSPSKGLIQKQQAKVTAGSHVFKNLSLLYATIQIFMVHFSFFFPDSLYFFIQSKEDYSNVWQSLQSSGPPHKPPAHWHKNVSLCINVCVHWVIRAMREQHKFVICNSAAMCDLHVGSAYKSPGDF